MSARLDFLYDISQQDTLTIRRQDLRVSRKKLEITRLAYEEAVVRNQLQELLQFFKVAIFGSARLHQDTTEFKFIVQLSQRLVEARNIDIVTGGGPGIMEAANRGLSLALEGTKSAQKGRRQPGPKGHGVGIKLPFEQGANDHVQIESVHQFFTSRLQEFINKIQGAYNAPGGIGTLLEMALLLQLRQVGHLEKSFPIVAHPDWEPVADAWNNELYHSRVATDRVPMISADDLSLLVFSKDIEEIVKIFVKRYDWWAENINSKVLFENKADKK